MDGMPLFEYQCRDCERAFEAFVTVERTPKCPGCHSVNLARLLSSPGMVGVTAGRSGPGESCRMPHMPGCGAGGCGCH
jgi:putative FmdB family regulatory protein